MKRFFILSLIAPLLFVSQAWADHVYSFTDSWVDWPGYTSQVSQTDELGTPKIERMDVTLSDIGTLMGVDIVLHDSNQWQEFNSLFINSYADSPATQWDEWDYLVHDGGKSNRGSTIGKVPGNGIFAVTQGYHYTMTDTSDWRHRQGNPNGIDKKDLEKVAQGSGWENTSQYLYSYSFDGLGIDLSDGFFVAFSPYCANDVIGGGVDLNPVPEPATMALMGLGLLGLAGIGRKKLTPKSA